MFGDRDPLTFVDPTGRGDDATAEAFFDLSALDVRQAAITVSVVVAVAITTVVLAYTIDEIIDAIRDQLGKRYGSYALFAQCWVKVALPMLKAAVPGLIALAEIDPEAFQVGLRNLYFAVRAALKECMEGGGGGPN